MKKLIIVLACLFAFGCATDEAIKKPSQSPLPNPVTTATPVVKIKETKDILHFITFKSEPMGAGIYAIDSQTGKEVGFFGTTPVRILVLKKKVDVEGFYINCISITPNVAGLTLTGKSGKVEQIEFQFKFKMSGYYDDIKLERLPLNTANDTDAVMSINLTPAKK